jgi:hypothetical protein
LVVENVIYLKMCIKAKKYEFELNKPITIIPQKLMYQQYRIIIIILCYWNAWKITVFLDAEKMR